MLGDRRNLASSHNNKYFISEMRKVSLCSDILYYAYFPAALDLIKIVGPLF